MGRRAPARGRPAGGAGPPWLLLSPSLHDGVGPSPPDRPWHAGRDGRDDRGPSAPRGIHASAALPPRPRDGRRVRPDAQPAAFSLARVAPATVLREDHRPRWSRAALRDL